MYLMLRTWCFFQGVFVFLTCSNVGQIDQIDHNLDNLDPNLPLWHVVQDLCSIDPTQEACPRSCRLYGFHSATWPRSYRSGIDLSVLNDLDHQVEIDDPSDVRSTFYNTYIPILGIIYQVAVVVVGLRKDNITACGTTMPPSRAPINNDL